MNLIKPLVRSSRSLMSSSELNPQFLREVKGKLKGINLIITVFVSVFIQLGIVINRLGMLPDSLPGKYLKEYSRYCFATEADKGQEYPSRLCHTDLLGHWDINWQLFWLDLFIDLSVIVVLSLLIGGVFLLIVDLVKEKERGTLSFIQFSPQSARTILRGKILGVPILLYIAVLFAFPLHLVAALQGGVSLNLIFWFEVIVLACCWLFYSVALLFSLVRTNFVGLKPWLGTGLLATVLMISTECLVYHGSAYDKNLFDWILLFNPLSILPYLIDHSNLSNSYGYYLPIDEIKEISFYGKHLWESTLGIGFALVNYYIWQYWSWKGLKRCFDNPNNTTFSKQQSYGITICFMFYALGFTLQTTDFDELFISLLALQFTLVIFFLLLTYLLSPKYQTIQDWTRYRHQFQKSERSIWKDLLLGEKSPPIIAIVANLALATLYVIPAFFIFDFFNAPQQMILGFVTGTSIILVYAFIAQRLLLVKHQKRAIWSLATVLALIMIPPIFIEIAGIEGSSATLITFLPNAIMDNVGLSAMITTLLGQWLIIALTGLQMTKQLQQMGKTETYLIS